jgi:hypothetical protein
MTGNPQPPGRDVAAEWAAAESATGGVRRHMPGTGPQCGGHADSGDLAGAHHPAGAAPPGAAGEDAGPALEGTEPVVTIPPN